MANKKEEMGPVEFRHPTIEEIQEAIRLERETTARQAGDSYYNKDIYQQFLEAIMIRNGKLTGVKPHEGASN